MLSSRLHDLRIVAPRRALLTVKRFFHSFATVDYAKNRFGSVVEDPFLFYLPCRAISNECLAVSGLPSRQAHSTIQIVRHYNAIHWHDIGPTIPGDYIWKIVGRESEKS